jgi:MATE family multidrug resistance protein
MRESATFHREFVRLAIINILSNLMVPLAGLIDVAFLGHLEEIRHLAGVALATVLFNYIYWTFNFLRMGTTGTTAQAKGRDDQVGIIATLLRNGTLALALGCLILTLQYPIQEIGFHLLSATPEVKASGLDYYQAMIWGAPPTLINYVLLGWFLGQGQGGKVLVLSVVNNFTNVALNYWLVVHLGWESAGAGWGTSLSQYAMMVAGLLLVLNTVPLSKLWSLLPAIAEPVALKETLALNSNIMIRSFAMVFTFSSFINLSSALGTTVLAANTLMLQVVTFSAYFIDGVAFATESFAGIFRGQGERDRLVRLIWLSGSISLGLGLIFATLFNTLPDLLFGLLTSHETVVVGIGQNVLWLLPVLGFGSLAYMLDGYFLGLTEGRILRIATLIAALGFFLPIALVARHFHSGQMLWLALALFMVGRVLTLGSQVPQTLKE